MVSMAVDVFVSILFFSWLKTGSGNRMLMSDADVTMPDVFSYQATAVQG